MKGIGRVYDHVTPEMEQHILDVLEARWRASATALTAAELMMWFPRLRDTLKTGHDDAVQDRIAISSPFAS
ncbi:hypothetical protein [Saccharopolyspora taberi]|uniref:Uncharacterized protein n=1 Tax=Saccharopolyspora taberi TaxID=60895 RepID=A0ABN3VG25_9PSEU